MEQIQQILRQISGDFLTKANALNDRTSELLNQENILDPNTFRDIMQNFFDQIGGNLQEIAISMGSNPRISNLSQSMDVFGQTVENVSTSIKNLDFDFGVVSSSAQAVSNSSTTTSSNFVSPSSNNIFNNIFLFIRSHPWLFIGSVATIGLFVIKNKKIPIPSPDILPSAISQPVSSPEIEQLRAKVDSNLYEIFKQFQIQNEINSNQIQAQKEINSQIFSILKTHSVIAKVLLYALLGVVVMGVAAAVYVAIKYRQKKYLPKQNKINQISD